MAVSYFLLTMAAWENQRGSPNFFVKMCSKTDHFVLHLNQFFLQFLGKHKWYFVVGGGFRIYLFSNTVNYKLQI